MSYTNLARVCSTVCMLTATVPAFSSRAASAGPADPKPLILPGYASRIAGEVLKYHAPDPAVQTGLLVRSLDAKRRIEWTTAHAPSNITSAAVEFVWMFALDVNPAQHRFELHVNGTAWFEFRNPPTSDVLDWTLDGPRGASLRFRATMIDRYDDLMGYAILRVPRESLTPGQPLRLSVVGESVGSRAWYITFQASVAADAALETRPAVIRSRDGEYQPLVLTLTHLDAPTEVTIKSSFAPDQVRTLQLGGNRFELRHPTVSEPADIHVKVEAPGHTRQRLSARIEPVRHWQINLVQHTHTDVGYTRPQTEILPEHLRYIDTALDYCDQTDGYPDDARFRWTCEASWAVREYLESRTPEQIERLRKRVAEGRIEVTAMFLNMSEVMDEASYAAFLAPIQLFRQFGLSVKTAMQNDINGAAWCLADSFAAIGIEYLTMGQHGHRAIAPFDKPTCFWWESPAGNRVLAFRADHYMTGNFWGVHTGRIEPAESALLRYLSNLEHAGYPFERIAVQHSGYMTDNSPPSLTGAEFVRAWNAKYVWPRLRCAIAREFPAFVKARHADALPVRRQAWPDWWTDGFGSAARESAVARTTQGQLIAIEGLLAMESALGVSLPAALASEIDAIRDDLLFYGEHTFGAAESIREPLCENSVVQWGQKAAYAWDAVKRTAVLLEAAIGRLPSMIDRSDGPRLVVVNTLNFPRSALLELYVDHELLPTDRPFRLIDERGRTLAVQPTRERAEGTYWAVWATAVPAFGWRTFRIEVEPEEELPPRPTRQPGSSIENEHYMIRVDPESGALTSLIDKRTAANLTDPSGPWGFGQIVYETLGNREQLEAFMLEDYERIAPKNVVVEGVLEGPVWTSLAMHGELPTCAGPDGVRWEVRLFHPHKRIEIHYTLQKRRNFDPEAVYVAFPFAPANGRLSYETLGGIAEIGADILSGAASDWQTTQSFAAVRGPDGQTVFSTNEIPLVQFGEINIGKYMRDMRAARPHIFSWVMNNYWTTNFKASQEGEFRFSYALTSDEDTSRSQATRFGWSHRVPLVGRVVPGGGAAPMFDSRSLLAFDAPNLILVAARPSPEEQGIFLHLREVDGRSASLATKKWTIKGEPARVTEVSVLQQPMRTGVGAVDFQAYETKFLLVRAAEQGAR